MSLGLEFILKANSAAFTKAMAGVNNSLKDVKKGLREFDVGNGLKNALGVGGIIAGFRLAITNAMELRDAAEKIGHTVDNGTRSVAELGDALGTIGTGFKNGLTAGLSFFTQIGDAARHYFQGVTQDQEDAARKMVATTGKAADEAEARLKKSREDNSPEKQKDAQEKLTKAQAEAGVKGTDAEKKLANLLNERVALEEKLAGTGKATVAHKEIEALIATNEKDTKEATASLDKDAAEKAKKSLDERIKGNKEYNDDVAEGLAMDREKQKEVREKFAPSVEQLAGMSAGGFADANDPRIKAKKILEKEKFAAEAGSRGDIKGAMKLGTEAQSMRDSLNKTAGSGTALTAETAESALKNALETTNKELEGVREQLKGLIKAQ